jgi:hypothetical protein
MTSPPDNLDDAAYVATGLRAGLESYELSEETSTCSTAKARPARTTSRQGRCPFSP